MSQTDSSRSTNSLGSQITFTRNAVGKCCYQAGHSYSAKSPVRFQATVSHNRINDDLKITHDDSTFNSWLSRCDPNQNLVYMCNRSDEAFSFWWFLVPMKCVLNVSQIHFACATRVFQVTSKAFSEQFFCVSNASPLMVDLYQGCISDACLLHIKWISVASHANLNPTSKAFLKQLTEFLIASNAPQLHLFMKGIFCAPLAHLICISDDLKWISNAFPSTMHLFH